MGLTLERVKAMQSYGIVAELNDYDWFHVNFKARDPNSPDSSDKVLFAEFMLSKDHDVEALSDHGIILSIQIINISDPGWQKCAVFLTASIKFGESMREPEGKAGEELA